MINIDGVEHKATWLKGLEQTADILNGEKSGRLQGSHNMYLEYVATFFNHKGIIRRDTACTEKEWDDLFLVLANPINRHSVAFPFGVNQTLIQEIYISQAKRALLYIKETNKWENVISVTFTAMAPAWCPNGVIRGLS